MRGSRGPARCVEGRTLHDLPPEIAFLLDYDIPLATLRRGAALARRDSVSADRALLAYDLVDADRLYRDLAHRLDVPFVKHRPRLAAGTRAAQAVAAGHVRLALRERRALLAAPTGAGIRRLLETRARRDLLGRLALTTPAHLSSLVRDHCAAGLAHAASHHLPEAAPRLSARGKFDRSAAGVSTAMLAAVLVGGALDWHIVADALGAVFFCAMVFRLLVSAAGAAPSEPDPAPIADAAAPVYSVLVPLYGETAVVPGLVAALKALDYPRSKLEILVLTESDDVATRAALFRAGLPPFFEVLVVPDGSPRTKPRALNYALQIARGDLVTVYDAEDRPDPLQLRRAAAAFAAAGPQIGCLQARLAISNAEAGVIPTLFAIEYAALFDVYNIGVARWRLPMALGGTSNHFRARALRRAGGWDAWNVTEDADLGFRLARFGIGVATLTSTTLEDAPTRPEVWFRQRRRWMKGWMQTLLVLARDPSAPRAFGPGRTLALGAMLTNLVTGPLAMPYALALLLRQMLRPMGSRSGAWDMCETTLAASVLALGIASTLGCASAGIARRRLGRRAPALALLPIYLLAISAATWGALRDLVRRPYHWHKTEHEAAMPTPHAEAGGGTPGARTARA